MGKAPGKAAERAFLLDEMDMFEFDLAETLGMTVSELRQRMSSDEYTCWQARQAVLDAVAGMRRRTARTMGARRAR